jgi:sugar phosphate isomerase/epimerase
MIYGYRVVREEEIGLYPVSLIQISVFRGWAGGIEQMMRVISKCRSLNLRYVIHPLGYFLSETRLKHRKETMDAMRTFARNVDLALIIHDETTPWGTRLEGIYEEAYKEALYELSAICPVSIENANNTLDIKWFWRRFATSVTLDIGHIEAAGIDSERFIIELGEDIIEKVNYIHLHRFNGVHDGLLDHWSLLENCRELRAFENLLKRKQDIGVILEINDMENLGESLMLVKKYLNHQK